MAAAVAQVTLCALPEWLRLGAGWPSQLEVHEFGTLHMHIDRAPASTLRFGI